MDIVILFLILLLLIPGTYSAYNCQASACDYYGVPIRFPFQLSPLQPQSCGYPGYNVVCNSERTTVLNLPYSGDFLVKSINYRRQVIKLYDPYKCLPKRLLELNLTDSPFKAAYYQNYTLLSCPPELDTSRFTTITCLSNSTSTVVATSSMILVNSLTTCKIFLSSLIPVSRPPQDGDGLSSDLSDNLELKWSVPNCDGCEENGGLCKIRNTTSGQPACSHEPKTGALHVFRIIALCITVPAIVTSIVIGFFICFTKSPNGNNQDAELALQSVNDSQGLDETTIESYTKVIIGESRRLPAGPNDITCPICLSDYHANETLKCIPECQHCFHSECIDEWLRRKGTCPVCRNSPSPAHVNSSSAAWEGTELEVNGRSNT
ncbi:putative RING-H2 finger protein ATL21A [Apium graveolens]|uniref:putative RING-H2 finger protein ATL21A n=1 Tax=Apium graveolens TaxID=4045 RepID=UPI003D7C0E1F